MINFKINDHIEFTYTNWKGDTSKRQAIVKEFLFGSNEYHPEKQVIIGGFDLEKADFRTYTTKDISDLRVMSREVE